jgi:ADP-ribose pyrophosphatase
MMSDQTVQWSDYAFEGRLIKVRVDTVDIPGTGLREREIVEHPGAVGVVPVLPDGRVVLVRQYRPATGQTLLEIPAGTMEPGEQPETTAARELEEETGYAAGELRHLLSFFVSPGWCTEQLICYVATGIEQGTQDPEDDEQIAVVIIQPEEIPGRIQQGQIADAKTIVSLVAYFGIQLGAQ